MDIKKGPATSIDRLNDFLSKLEVEGFSSVKVFSYNFAANSFDRLASTHFILEREDGTKAGLSVRTLENDMHRADFKAQQDEEVVNEELVIVLPVDSISPEVIADLFADEYWGDHLTEY